MGAYNRSKGWLVAREIATLGKGSHCKPEDPSLMPGIQVNQLGVMAASLSFQAGRRISEACQLASLD